MSSHVVSLHHLLYERVCIMADEKKIVGIEVKIPESIDGALTNLSAPITKGVGSTLGQLWNIALGSWINFLSSKKDIKYAVALKKYEDDLRKKVEDIPAEYLKEPDIQVTMSALTTSLFCVENEELRKLFATLIASSMDSRRSHFVHPTFSILLQQFTSRDALTFQGFGKGRVRPVLSGKTALKGSHATYIWEIHDCLVDDSVLTIRDQSESLTYLVHLGLIRIEYDDSALEKLRYCDIEPSIFSPQENERLFNYLHEMILSNKVPHERLDKNSYNFSLDASFGVAKLTTLGENLRLAVTDDQSFI